ncbi:hypothetical protein BRCON_0954 [Candidatus Sumerlaea chitinivorans]|uniref:Uncharacterized protein n=1 Tax=Sumerlaea chitinivorans TaxID=2250252 RepID=A0A2Z4Y3F4_SUMC1|nr:hypothetical protein BRCON_0954 [Candidatus Sumerlaea chitinivorans]
MLQFLFAHSGHSQSLSFPRIIVADRFRGLSGASSRESIGCLGFTADSIVEISKMAKRKRNVAKSSHAEATIRSFITAEEQVGNSRKPALWQYGGLALVVLIVFGRAVTFGFTDWDDNLNVYENPYLLNLSLSNLLRLWYGPYASLYVPLVYTSYFVEISLTQAAMSFLAPMGEWLGIGVSVGRLIPAIMHFDNILLHLLGAFSVLRILSRLDFPRWATFAGSVLFAVHPLQVEPVAWITGRKDVLSGALALCAIDLFQSHLVDSTLKRRLLFATACFILALFAKPSVVTLPLLAAIFAWYHGVDRRRWGRALSLWLLAAVVIAVVGQRAQSDLNDAPFSLLWWQRPFLAADNLRYYFVKFFVPLGLAPIAPRTVREAMQSPLFWLSLPAACLVAWAIRRHKGLVLSAAWIVVPIFPVLGFVPFIFQHFSTVADRYCYLSLGGAALAVVIGISKFDQAYLQRFPKRKPALFAAVSVWLIMLALISFRQVGYWAGPETLWKRELAVHPTCTHALYNLASRYADQGKFPEAIELYSRLLEVDPRYAPAYSNLILIYGRLGMTQKAKEVARAALTLPPGSAENFLARGHAFLELGDGMSALQSFQAALTILPEDVPAINSLGMAYLAVGDTQKAEEAFRRALELNPNFGAAHANLGLIYLKRGMREAALKEFRKAIELDPTDVKSKHRLRALENAETTPSAHSQ